MVRRLHFYGADQIIEDSFSEGEREIAKLLGDLSEERLAAMSDEDLQQVRFFVHYQAFRTKAAVVQADNMATALSRYMMAETARLNGEPLTPEELEGFSVRHEAGAAYLFELATRMVPATQDLEVRYLRNSHKEKFLIGDHPVVLYNRFAEYHRVLKSKGNATGLAAKGLQIVMPLSPTLAVMLLDSSCYEMDSSRAVCNIGPKDVAALNRMQAVNALETLFFHPAHRDDKSFQSLLESRAKHSPIHESSVKPLGTLVEPGKDPGELLRVRRPQVRVRAPMGFLRVTERHDFRDHRTLAFPVRNPMIRPLLEAHDDVLNEEIEKARRRK